ncbi:MAG: hypothetical protein H7Z40_11940, partial [Phycisphaerae bacterium]|nr:hypothetical protein [Gemmatimonadaceae bacterium]
MTLSRESPKASGVENPESRSEMMGGDAVDPQVSADEFASSSLGSAFVFIADLATRLARTTDFEAGSLSALTLLRKYLRASHVELELMRASDRRILTAEAPASLVGALPVSGAPTGTVRHSLPLMAAGEP